MRSCLTEIELRLADELGDDIYLTQTKTRIMAVLRPVEAEEAWSYLSNCRVSRLYKHAIHNQKVFAEDFQDLSNFKNDPRASQEMRSLRNSCRFAASNYRVSGQKSVDVYGDLATLNEDRLLFLLDILRALRGAIAVAASSSSLDDTLLSTLGRQLAIFDNNSLYPSACRMLAWKSPREPYLVHPHNTNWWSVLSLSICHTSTHTNRLVSTTKDDQDGPENAVLAYPAGQNMRSKLTFVVPAVSVRSVIPVAMAWKQADSALGSTRDSNFWQGIASGVMQLLGLFVFVWPTLKDRRLSQLTWFWIWLLAGFSAACSIVSVPLYLRVPTIWSFVFSFVGVLAQAVVQLQVVNAL